MIDISGFEYDIKSNKYIDVKCSLIIVDNYEVLLLETLKLQKLKFDKRLCKRVKIYFE